MTMTVDEFVKIKVLPECQDIVTVLRVLMKESAPDAIERGSATGYRHTRGGGYWRSSVRPRKGSLLPSHVGRNSKTSMGY